MSWGRSAESEGGGGGLVWGRSQEGGMRRGRGLSESGGRGRGSRGQVG